MIRLSSGRLTVAASRFWEHPRLGDVFPVYLSRLYHVANSTLALMEAARDRAHALAPACAVAALLDGYLDHHLREEREHDVWLLHDLEVLGVTRDEVVDRLPAPEVGALIGTLSYWCEYHHPVAILAYLHVAEGRPQSKVFLDEVVRRTGLPKHSLHWYYRHAALDVRHALDIREQLDTLPLTVAHRALLRTTVLSVLQQMSQFVESCVSIADRLGPATGESGAEHFRVRRT